MKFAQNNKPHPYFQGEKNSGTSSTSEKPVFFLHIEIQVVAHSQDQGKEFPENGNGKLAWEPGEPGEPGELGHGSPKTTPKSPASW